MLHTSSGQGRSRGGEFRGGFSDVSGLNTEITHADYREGTDPVADAEARREVATSQLAKIAAMLR